MALTEQLSAEGERQRSEIAAIRRENEELKTLVTKLHGEVMGMRNAPNPLATTIPGIADPMQQAMNMQQTGAVSREPPQSSLDTFVEEKRRPGRPRKNPEPEVA